MIFQSMAFLLRIKNETIFNPTYFSIKVQTRKTIVNGFKKKHYHAGKRFKTLKRRNIMRGFRLYAVVTNSLFMIVALTALGYMIGAHWWLRNAVWGGILGLLGAFIGLVLLIVNVLKYSKKEGDSN